jgi:hypothetical protein
VSVGDEAIVAAIHDDGAVSSWNVRTGRRHGPDLRHDATVTAAAIASRVDSFTAPRPVVRMLRPGDGGLLLVDRSGLVRL